MHGRRRRRQAWAQVGAWSGKIVDEIFRSLSSHRKVVIVSPSFQFSPGCVRSGKEHRVSEHSHLTISMPEIGGRDVRLLRSCWVRIGRCIPNVLLSVSVMLCATCPLKTTMILESDLLLVVATVLGATWPLCERVGEHVFFDCGARPVDQQRPAVNVEHASHALLMLVERCLGRCPIADTYPGNQSASPYDAHANNASNEKRVEGRC